ncbi:hypothetical protein [Kangiella sediminilitoris]|uniref:Uncharacterized protein n=1 Tax=Kangiella sediminilitoris TaxID=1144748 RepID=A0A1B3B8Y2_9GAMM|nr:hypothetical protein [Kangiella sediminilitoris]AOE49259.1 hypothetical protein KS2013_535 [Kangiella sediminilitoris]
MKGKLNFKNINIFLTILLAVSAITSSYFSYQIVKISEENIKLLEEQQGRESRKELREMLELFIKVHKEYKQAEKELEQKS